MHIAVVMITKDRSEKGRQNYFAATLNSLVESGMFESRIVSFQFDVFDGGSISLRYLRLGEYHPDLFTLHTSSSFDMPPNVNAGRALLHGGTQSKADWVLFLEDDILVCKDFFQGVEMWLLRQAREDRHAYMLYTPYREIEVAFKNKQRTWEYPVNKFYGTQAFAIRSFDAMRLGRYLIDLPYGTSGYDMEMKKWHIETYGENGFFLSSVPSFVQHVGRQSLLFDDRFHECSSWQGKDWSALDWQGDDNVG